MTRTCGDKADAARQKARPRRSGPLRWSFNKSERHSMDIQYLLFLQQIRNSAGPLMTTLMVLVSDIAIYGSITAALIIYWCVDRVQGYWILANCVSGFMVNNTLKLAACVYRPWIRDPRIVPPPAALKSATGYSFPSGHTQFAASFFGSVAIYNRKKYWQLIAPCIFCILLTGFSRNYLGVHTPQDVLVSFLIGALILKVSSVVFDRIQADPALFPRLIPTGCVLVILCALFFHFKSYPLHLMDGKPIVDPLEMVKDGYMACGISLGFMIGALIETRYIRFTADGSLFKRVIRFLCGLPVPALLLLFVKKPLYALTGSTLGHLFLYFVLALYFTAGYPAVFTAIKKRLPD